MSVQEPFSRLTSVDKTCQIMNRSMCNIHILDQNQVLQWVHYIILNISQIKQYQSISYLPLPSIQWLSSPTPVVRSPRLWGRGRTIHEFVVNRCQILARPGAWWGSTLGICTLRDLFLNIGVFLVLWCEKRKPCWEILIKVWWEIVHSLNGIHTHDHMCVFMLVHVGEMKTNLQGVQTNASGQLIFPYPFQTPKEFVMLKRYL